MLLTLLILGQQIPNRTAFPIPLESVKLPVLAGFQEIVLGTRVQTTKTLGLIENQLEAGHYGDKVPINYHDARIGHTTWSVSPGVMGSTPCLALSSTAHRNQAWTVKKSVYELRHRASRTWYISEGGRLLGETCVLDLATGQWTMDVTYNTDDYTVTFAGPNKGLRTQTVTPGCGMEALTVDPFRPMLKPGKDGTAAEILVKDKEFYMLDPMTVSPVKHTARVSGTFGGELFNRKWRGQEVEISGGKESQRVWIADDGRLLRVNLPKGTFLELEQL